MSCGWRDVDAFTLEAGLGELGAIQAFGIDRLGRRIVSL
jgi:hypothetical protein